MFIILHRFFFSFWPFIKRIFEKFRFSEIMLVLAVCFSIIFYSLYKKEKHEFAKYKNQNEKREEMMFRNRERIESLNKTIESFLKEHLDEDFALSSNDIFNLNRSIQLCDN